MISQHRFKKVLRGYRRGGINGMRRAVGLKPLPTGCQRPSAGRRNAAGQASGTVKQNRKIGLLPPKRR